MWNKIIATIAPYLPENNRVERIWKIAQVDFQRRYYNDKLGLFWALLNPLIQIAIYYSVFKIAFNVETENYGIYIFAGIVLWSTFSEAATRGMGILYSKRYLIENIQFNQIDLFFSHCVSVYMGLGFNLLAYFIISASLGIVFGVNILWLPIILINLFIICMGVSLILATIKIYLDDIVHAWSVLVLAGFWGAGIFFPGEKIIEMVPLLKYFHPFIGMIMNMRNITMYNSLPNYELMIINFLVGIIILVIGIMTYKRFSYKAIELM